MAIVETAVETPVRNGTVEVAGALRARMAETAELSGAQVVWESLLGAGVEVVFGYPGGYVLPLYDALPDYALRHVLVRHEQAAAHAADGYARATGRVGVCLATSGPGATNLVSGIAAAYLDSSPVLAITGQVSTPLIGKNAFQEVNITKIVEPITKARYQVRRVQDLASTLLRAARETTSGRPGPVLVDIPKDVMVAPAQGPGGRGQGSRERGEVYRPPTPDPRPPAPDPRAAVELINAAERPVIVAGHGVILSGAYAELRRVAERGSIPVATTLLGISCFPETHFLSLGMLGMHGTTYANKAVEEADLILAVGVRFDDRVTGRVEGFAPKARIVHVDVDRAEIGKNVRVDVPLLGDARAVLRALAPAIAANHRTSWLAQIERWRSQHPSRRVPAQGAGARGQESGVGSRENSPRSPDPWPLTPDPRAGEVLPQFVIDQLYQASRGRAIVVSDVGQNQMWAAMHYWYDRPNSHITSGGLGCMGFSLPAAIGAQIGRPEEQVWVVCGDGGFQMNAQELATLAQEGLPIKVALLNNGCLGMVRQWQELFYGQRYVEAVAAAPDFVALAHAYGVSGFRVKEKNEVRATIQRAIEHPGPVVIEFMVRPEECVFPMVPPSG